jgi:hypothetical protein
MIWIIAILIIIVIVAAWYLGLIGLPGTAASTETNELQQGDIIIPSSELPEGQLTNVDAVLFEDTPATTPVTAPEPAAPAAVSAPEPTSAAAPAPVATVPVTTNVATNPAAAPVTVVVPIVPFKLGDIVKYKYKVRGEHAGSFCAPVGGSIDMVAYGQVQKIDINLIGVYWRIIMATGTLRADTVQGQCIWFRNDTQSAANMDGWLGTETSNPRLYTGLITIFSNYTWGDLEKLAPHKVGDFVKYYFKLNAGEYTGSWCGGAPSGAASQMIAMGTIRNIESDGTIKVNWTQIRNIGPIGTHCQLNTAVWDKNADNKYWFGTDTTEPMPNIGLRATFSKSEAALLIAV